MIDVCQVIRRELMAAGYQNVTCKRLDDFTGREGVIVRPVAVRSTATHYDHDTSDDYIVAIYCRSASEEIAMTKAWDIADYLREYPLISDTNAYLWTASEVYTEPQELSAEGYFCWVLQMSISIERKGR